MGTRQGPPAPVVKAVPQVQAPVQAAEPAPIAEPAPAKKPVKQGTKVYAYKDPAQVPDPVSETAPADSATARPATAPASGEQPRRAPAPDARGQQVAKADTRQQLPKTVEPPSVPTQPEPQPPPAPAASKLPESNFTAPNLPAAAEALSSQAERQRQAGDYAGAAASLERSLRIAPREPYLWNRLARVRMEQGQSAQAGNLAARSNDLSGQNPEVKKDNWRIIAEAKRRAGDVAGANEAQQRAETD